MDLPKAKKHDLAGSSGGIFFGVASVFYSMREHIWVYPTGIVSTLIYVSICFEYKLYADMGINATILRCRFMAGMCGLIRRKTKKFYP